MEHGFHKILDGRINGDISVDCYRKSARCIISLDNMLLMIYSEFYDDYTFPGGGIEEGEDIITGLKRECLEEAGVYIDTPLHFANTVEYRLLSDNKSIQQYDSVFYTSDIIEHGKQKLEDYEKELGYRVAWIDIDEVIVHNQKKREFLASKDFYTGVLDRELYILDLWKKKMAKV